MIRRASLAIVVCLVFAAPSFARDFHVNNVVGDDRLDGSDERVVNDLIGPMRSIGRALKAAQAGDRIVLANTGQPYRECVALQGARHGSNGIRRFQIVGNGATLDGRVPVAMEAWRHESGEVFSFQPHLQGQQLLYLNDRPLSLLAVKSAEEIEQLEPLQWAWFQGRIYFRAEKDRLPDYYELSYCGHPVGITLFSVTGVEISDLTVQGYQVDGISAPDDVSDVVITGSVLRGNARSGVHIGGASRVLVEACLVGDNGKAQVHCTDYCRVQIVNCDLVDSNPSAPTLVSDETARVEQATSDQ